MTDDTSAILDDLLCRWHQWANAVRLSRGWKSRALVVGEYRTSRQYDDANGALDDEIDRTIMRAVDFQVGEMVDPWKAAIHANARALVVGCMVFSSPRLSPDPALRLAQVAEARAQLVKRLTGAGVI